MGEGKKAPLIIQRATWSAQAEAALMPAAFGEMPIIKAQVLGGIAVLWRCDGCADGWMVTRQEPAELVVVVAAGRNCRPVLRHVLQQARAAGLTMRVHVRRAGMKRICEREGMTLGEYVMRA